MIKMIFQRKNDIILIVKGNIKMEIELKDALQYKKYFEDLIKELEQDNNMTGEKELLESLDNCILNSSVNNNNKIIIDPELLENIIWVKSKGVGDYMTDIDEKYYSIVEEIQNKKGL